MTFCGQCGTEIAEKDGFCTACGRKVARKKHLIEAKIIDVEHVQSVNNWSDIYQSVEKFSKEKQEKKRLAKEEKEKERLAKKEKEEKPEKYVASPVLPQSNTFSFSSNRFLPLVVVGFGLGLVTFILIGASVSGTSDPYGCTVCDPFHPAYDGPPPIEMDLWVPDDYYYDDSYYYDDYYDGGYYP